MMKIQLRYRLCHRFRLTKLHDYFWVDFDHFWVEGHFWGSLEQLFKSVKHSVVLFDKIVILMSFRAHSYVIISFKNVVIVDDKSDWMSCLTRKYLKIPF